MPHTGCNEGCGGGETHSDNASVGSGSSKRSGGHHSSSSDVCSGDGTVLTSLTDFNVLRFRSNFLEAVEELRMRRCIDVENEERIKQLFTKTHELEQKLEEEKSHYAALTEGHSRQEEEIRKQYEEQLKQVEDEKAKCCLSSESRERELKALKDEIRALQLAKYNLEKKVQEQDRQLQLQTSSRDNHLSQMSQLEQKCSTAFRQATEVSEQIERVERNVKQAIELNRKLQYVNSHQQCTIEVCRKDLQNCREELVKARVQSGGQQGEEAVRGGEYPARVRATEQELKMQVELSRQLQAQLVGLREEHQAILQRLKEAHSLIERHVETNAQLSASEAILLEEKASLKEKCRELEEQLRSSMEQFQSVEEKCNTEAKEWKDKCAEIENRLKTLQADYSALQASHDELEVAKLAAQKRLDRQASEGKEAQENLEEKVKLVQEEIRELKDRSLKESHEWSEKLEKLQTALEQSEQLLAEKEKLLEVAGEQYHALEAKCKEQLQLRAIITAPAASVTCAQGNDGDQQGCLNSIQPSEALSNHMEAEAGVGSSTENHTAVVSVPVPPRSPILSPDVISGSPDSAEITSSPLLPSIEEPLKVTVGTSKNLLPRIHLEKLHLPFTRHCKGNEDTANRLNVEPAVLQQCKGCGDKEADLSPASSNCASVLKTAPKRVAEESVKDSEVGESPTKKPRISVASESGALPVVEKSTKTAESSPVSENGEQSEKRDQVDSQGSNGDSQKPACRGSSRPHRSQSELSPQLHAEHNMYSKSSPDPRSLSNHKNRGGSLSQPVLSSATNSEHHPGRISATLPSSWKLETPKLNSLWTGTNPSRPYHHILSCKPGKQSQPPLNYTAVQEGLTSSPSVPQKDSIKNCPGRIGFSKFSPQDQGTSSIVSQPTNTCNNSSSTSVSPAHAKVKYNNCDTCQEGKKPTSCPQSPSIGNIEVRNTLTKDDSIAVLFSEDDEEEEDCGSADTTMLNSQMNRQIERVQMFLRMDRLRRTKPFK